MKNFILKKATLMMLGAIFFPFDLVAELRVTPHAKEVLFEDDTYTQPDSEDLRKEIYKNLYQQQGHKIIVKTLVIKPNFSSQEIITHINKGVQAAQLLEKKYHKPVKLYLNAMGSQIDMRTLQMVPSSAKPYIYRLNVSHTKILPSPSHHVQDLIKAIQSYQELQQLLIFDVPLTETETTELTTAMEQQNTLLATKEPVIAVIVLDGVTNYELQKFLSLTLHVADSMPLIHGILLKITSPGGPASNSFNMGALVKNSAKPVYTFIDSMAASGGYAVASQSQKIYSLPHSIIGSIGVIWQRTETKNNTLWDVLGLSRFRTHSFFAGKYKGLDHPDQPFNSTMKKKLQKELEQCFQDFKNIVQQGRNLSDEQIHAVATGEMWSAIDAQRLKLIDHIGTEQKALKDLSRLIGTRTPLHVMIQIVETKPPTEESLKNEPKDAPKEGSSSSATKTTTLTYEKPVHDQILGPYQLRFVNE